MNHPVELNEIEINEIRILARDKRVSLTGIGEKTPIANDIYTILDQLNIKLLEYPIFSRSDRPAFSAAILCCEENGEDLIFIGLNTADYFDKQIFAIAHELYHYFTKTGYHLSRSNDAENLLIEAKANRFAAEFLLPGAELKSIILDEFKTSDLSALPEKALLRFIVRLQCTWWLPFRSLVKRLNEIEAINDEQYRLLYSIDERNLKGEYGRMGIALNEEIFKKLNSKTNIVGTSMKYLDVILRNFEDGLIGEDELAETLKVFNKSPEEFGFEITAYDEEELDDLLTEGNCDES